MNEVNNPTDSITEQKKTQSELLASFDSETLRSMGRELSKEIQDRRLTFDAINDVFEARGEVRL